MVLPVIEKTDCDHRGWALWISVYGWWCGNCGKENRNVDYLRVPKQKGDLVEFA